MISCWSHSVLCNTGINTGIPVLIFLNTEIPVLPNVLGIGGPSSELCKKMSALAYSTEPWPMKVKHAAQ